MSHTQKILMAVFNTVVDSVWVTAEHRGYRRIPLLHTAGNNYLDGCLFIDTWVWQSVSAHYKWDIFYVTCMKLIEHNNALITGTSRPTFFGVYWWWEKWKCCPNLVMPVSCLILHILPTLQPMCDVIVQ